MRFGFGFVPNLPLAESLRVIQRGEQLGYEMAWIPDQTFYRDPFLVMAAWAQATEHIQLMIGVTNPYTRHPAQVARAIATVDEISGGRAHLGIGSGNRRELLLPMGFEQDAAAARTREMLTLVRALLARRNPAARIRLRNRQGLAAFLATRAGGDPDLHRRPRRPYVGSGGRAGRWRGHRRARLRGGFGLRLRGAGTRRSPCFLRPRSAGTPGRNLTELEIVSWVTCRVVDDERAAHEQLKPSVAHIIGGAPLSLLRAIGMEDAAIDALKRAYAAGWAGRRRAPRNPARDRHAHHRGRGGTGARNLLAARGPWYRADRHLAHRHGRRCSLPRAGAHRS